MNYNQRNIKKMIRDTEATIPDEELFVSSAYQKYQTSLAKAVTGRYRYGLQVLMEWNPEDGASVAYTDNYKIHSNAANPITQSFPSRFLRSQSLTGLTGHEVAHLLYTDFTLRQMYLTDMTNGVFYPEEPDMILPAYQMNLEEIKEAMNTKDKAACLTLAKCAAEFTNILEDINIEGRICADYPGIFKQGIRLNNLRLSEQIPSIQDQIDQGYEPFAIMTNLLLSYCRTGTVSNPTGYSGGYMDTLADCMDFIDDALESVQGKDRLIAANHLLVLTWRYIKPLVERTRDELKENDDDAVNEFLEKLLGDQISGTPLPTGKGGALPKNIKPIPKEDSSEETETEHGAASRSTALSEAQKVLAEEGGRIALARTSAILDENNPGITYNAQYKGSGYENAAHDLFRVLNSVAAEKVQKECEQELTEELQRAANELHYGNAHAGVHVTVNRIPMVSDFMKKSYEEIAPPLLKASKRLQSTILPLLKEEQQGGKQKNLLYGKRLDTHALYKTDGTIFTRTRLPGDEKRLAVGLLVDESGSMSYGDRITHARKTAVVLYDFCKSLGIPITIYGHSTDCSGVALYSYAEFDSIDNDDCYRLMDMTARNGNRDGAALRFMAEHLYKRPETQKLLILISDGQPADCGYSGTEAEADLRGIKKEYEKKGVILFSAAVGDDKETIKRIYKDGFLDITKLEELPKNMAQLVKQYLV